MELLQEYGLWGMFLSAFLAATILPISSEPVLLALLYKGLPLNNLIIYATIGNILGGVLNYWLGYLGNLKWIDKFLGISKEKIEKIKLLINKYGAILAFFGWVPFIGDPILVGLGYFKFSFNKTLLLMSIGKCLRYVLLGYISYSSILP